MVFAVILVLYLFPQVMNRFATQHVVVYSVSGGAQASITYRTGDGADPHHTLIPTPWSITESMPSGATYSVSAQDPDRSDITCTVDIDGVQVTSSTSPGSCTSSGLVT